MIVSLKQYKTLKECYKLFQGYGKSIQLYGQEQFTEEVKKYIKEASTYPHHLLTIVKGRYLINEAKNREIPEFTSFIEQEHKRLEEEVNGRLYC